MRVILWKDERGRGKKGDVVDVPDSYARNYLIRGGYAEVATAVKINDIAQKKVAADFHKAEELKAARALAAELKGKSFSIKVRRARAEDYSAPSPPQMLPRRLPRAATPSTKRR